MIKDLTDHHHKMELDRLKRANNQLNGEAKIAREQLTLLQDELDAVQAIEGIDTFKIHEHKKLKVEATAIVLASDFHSEERVDPTTISGLNKFNLKIAAQRIDSFFVNTSRLLKSRQKSIHIKTLVVGLLGDFISGYIHEELIEMAQLPPIEAIVNVQNHLASGIEYLLKTLNVNLVLPCHSGNHGRLTRKVHHSTERGNSLEYYMYKQLANHFRSDRRVVFMIAGGYHSYLDLNGFMVRFHHGHAVKYQGGVGGITIPINKAISQWNKSKPAILDCFGHFHQLRYGGNYICNGSLIGYNAYALSIKADYEEPRQAFAIIHHGRQDVMDFCPIWVN